MKSTDEGRAWARRLKRWRCSSPKTQWDDVRRRQRHTKSSLLGPLGVMWRRRRPEVRELADAVGCWQGGGSAPRLLGGRTAGLPARAHRRPVMKRHRRTIPSNCGEAAPGFRANRPSGSCRACWLVGEARRSNGSERCSAFLLATTRPARLLRRASPRGRGEPRTGKQRCSEDARSGRARATVSMRPASRSR